MLDRLSSQIRLMVRQRAAPVYGPASLYAQAEHALSSPDSPLEPSSRSLRGRLVRRLFGLIWLFYLVSAFPELVHADLSPALAVPAWVALILFTLGYVVITLLGTPLWATGDPHEQTVNRAIIGTQIASLLVLIVLLPDWNFGYVFIYCAVSAGLFLVRRDAVRVLVLCIALSVLAGLYEQTNLSDIFTAVLLIGGIGANMIFWSALMAQNHALRRARAEIARLAVSEERLRIARDLHDLLGHNLSVIALKSELAGRLLDGHPQRAATEIADVQRVARTALQEVREAVAGYRMVSLEEEIEHSMQLLQAAGVSLAVRTTVGDLPMELDRGLAWFVREGTTNIIRHAGITTATLRIDRHGDHVFAEYRDTGDAAASRQTLQREDRIGDHPVGGLGLIGLGERIRSLGGEFSAGPMPDRGFRLYATLPLPAPTADPPGAEPVSPAADGRTLLESTR